MHIPTTPLVAVTVAGLAVGAAVYATGSAGSAHLVWGAVTTLGVGAAGWWVLDAARHRRLGADLIALLALVGTLVVGEYLAGAVVAVMLASGRALEDRATARAREELSGLLDRVPRRAHRIDAGGVSEIEVDDLAPGDLVLVKPGEVVPVDGQLHSPDAVVDESALTGEALPVQRTAGDAVRSGTLNAGGPLQLRATTAAVDSTYAGIARLVAGAEASSAPSVRLADRYAVGFLAVSLATAGGAWGVSGHLARAVAVLVVATPCPLILAVPVALVSGLSRTARRGVIVKGGAVLERLAQATVLLFDKTGTLTTGHPTVVRVVSAGGMEADDLLRDAASVDQLSPHVLAAAVVRATGGRGLALNLAVDVKEVPGQGIQGRVEGHAVAVGRAEWAGTCADPRWLRGVRRQAERDAQLTVFVGIDGALAGALLLSDPIRPDAARTIRRLRRDGITRVVMVTGDRAEVADAVGAVIGVDEVLAERTPAEKVDAVRIERRHGTTIMVGDGINDAPALALADIGVALGARGASASSEAADVVLSVDRLDRLGEAVVIAQRTLRVAAQSVAAGMGLSLVAMGVAAAGYLPAAWGALLQETIDVAVIANALRALRPGRRAVTFDEADIGVARRFSAEHATLGPDLDRIRAAADAIGAVPPAEALAAIGDVYRLLAGGIGPHEQAEDAELYPVLDRVLGGADPTATMSRAHVEISHQIRRLRKILDNTDPKGPDDDDMTELRRLLYGLHAILVLHFAQEDEGYLSLLDDAPPPSLTPMLPSGVR
ncbi:MAG: heavy metal translocating P-type ATPase [Acidimicrobiales bacterium]